MLHLVCVNGMRQNYQTSLRLYFMKFKSSASGTFINMRNYYFRLLSDDCNNTYLRRKLVITYLGTCKNDLNVQSCFQWRTKLLLDDVREHTRLPRLEPVMTCSEVHMHVRLGARTV